MTSTPEIFSPIVPTKFPDHTQLPESDGTFVLGKRTAGKNFQGHPQSILLTDSITPILQTLHPNGDYAIGKDFGIYWRMTDPPEKGAEAPDWFYVPNITPLVNNEIRRSYVLWQEVIPPLIVLEFVSGDGSPERDKTPWTGKFWVYEQVIRPAFYGIYEVSKSQIEVYHLIENRYELVTPNQRGHFPIPPLGVELGIWQGQYQNVTLPWLRWWDAEGNLLLTGEARAEHEKGRADQERERADTTETLLQEERQQKELAQQRAEILAQKLREMGINPDE